MKLVFWGHSRLLTWVLNWSCVNAWVYAKKSVALVLENCHIFNLPSSAVSCDLASLLWAFFSGVTSTISVHTFKRITQLINYSPSSHSFFCKSYFPLVLVDVQAPFLNWTTLKMENAEIGGKNCSFLPMKCASFFTLSAGSAVDGGREASRDRDREDDRGQVRLRAHDHFEEQPLTKCLTKSLFSFLLDAAVTTSKFPLEKDALSLIPAHAQNFLKRKASPKNHLSLFLQVVFFFGNWVKKKPDRILRFGTGMIASEGAENCPLEGAWNIWGKLTQHFHKKGFSDFDPVSSNNHAFAEIFNLCF